MKTQPQTIDWKNVVLPFARTMASEVMKAVEAVVLNGDAIVGKTAGGDIKSLADQAAAEAVRKVMRDCSFPAAILIEDTGQIEFTDDGVDPVVLFVIDELDGSRVALRGGSYFSICVGALPFSYEPKLKDVQVGVIRNPNGRLGEELTACVGHGVTFNCMSHELPAWQHDAPINFDLEISGGLWPIWGMYASPFEGLCPNGVQVVQSSGWSARTIAASKLGFFLHLPSRIKRVWPELIPEMEATHGGATGSYPWDLAASFCILRELGCVVIRSDGESLDNVRLDKPVPHDALMARSPALAAWVVEQLDAVEKRLLTDRAGTIAMIETVLGRPLVSAAASA